MSPSRRPYQGLVVAHTHWDREWYATFEQYRIRLVRLIDKLLDLLEGDPRFQYFTLDGQTIVLEDYLAIRPENEGRLRALVQSGRLLIGPWYVLPDEFLVSGEALVRNLMLGAKTGLAFGPLMPVGYVPDPFGHIAQLPQILAGFGIDSFIFSRGLGEEGEELGSEFVWQAPDGSAVLAIHQLGWDDRNTGYLNASSLGYATPWVPRSGPPDFALAIRQLVALGTILRRYARTPYLLFNNGCDHLEPQPELPALLERANEEREEIEFRQATFPQYVDAVRPFLPRLAVWQGELRRSRYAPLLSGVFSARIHLKQENARAQTLLERWAEPFCAIAAEEGACYPAAFLWHAWRQLIQNHPHDSICGCSVDQVHAEMATRFARSEQVAEHCCAESLAFLAAAADRSWLPQNALPLAVFNPLGWPRSDVAELTLDLPAEWDGAAGFEVVAPDGRRRACSVLSRQRHQPQQSSADQPVDQVTLAIPVDVPAFGYAVCGLLPSQSTDPVSAPSYPIAIANDLYQVVAQPDGTVDVTHKPTGHTIRGALSLLDEADAGDEYTFAPLPGDVPLASRHRGTVLRLVDSGPAGQTIQIAFDRPLPAGLDAGRRRRSDLLLECPIRMRVGLREGVDRVDVQVDLQNASADHRLRLLLPTGIQTPRVAVAGHFGVVERNAALPEGADWAERPSATNHQGGFVDASDGRRGVALIAAGLPEYEAIPGENGLTLALTLLRCVGWLSRDDIPSRPGHAGPGLPTPGAQCPGNYTFRCALQIHDGDWLAGQTYRRALEHNVPLRVVPIVTAPGAAQARPLPPALSFLTLEGEGLVLSAMKRSEDGRWLVVRLYNATGETVAGRLSPYRPLREAALLRLDEAPLATVEPDADGSLPFEARGGQVVTFGLQLATP